MKKNACHGAIHMSYETQIPLSESLDRVLSFMAIRSGESFLYLLNFHKKHKKVFGQA